MAEAIVSFGLQKLWDLLGQEYEQFQGVDDQVTELKHDLNLLSSFLKDAEAKKHTSAVVRSCVEEIKEIICDAEDIIETFLLKEELGKTSGFRKRVKQLAFIILDRRELASDIGGISKRISKVVRDMQSFGVQQIIADGRYMQPLHDRFKEMRETFPRDGESNLVGLEENVKKLVGYLVDEENIQVVSMTGMGGIGKTTIARQVFNHDMVKHEFDGVAWVCVSQEFTRKYVWQTIFRNLRPSEKEDKIMEMTEPSLQDNLFRLLETSKSLIILDDIWKEEDWDRIKAIFPPNKGWKVLLTSRNESVAVRGDTTYVNFKPECLTIEDSWTLFQRIAFSIKDASEFKVDEVMEEMGKQMIKHCGGLPLAITVLGGLLAAKYKLHDWKRVFEDIVGRTNYNDDNNNMSVYHVLSLSFEELPSYLKHCFLYLGHFPEDYQINVEKLSYYWAAEGILKSRDYDRATIRDVADGYIEELARRNMVIAERDVTTLRFETCNLHDMMREVCLSKAREENFLQIGGTCSSTIDSQSPCASRRLVLQYPTRIHERELWDRTTLHVNVEREVNNPKVRSLLVICDMVEDVLMVTCLRFTRLQLLRLLDLSGTKFEGGKLPSSIGNLIHLRYLSLERAGVSHLPPSLQNLKLLIYLNLKVLWDSNLDMPNCLIGMRELRYLALPRFMRQNKLDLSNLVNLESLYNFVTRNCSFGDLFGMAKLKTLEIFYYREVSVEMLSSSIAGLRHLENLTIKDALLTTCDNICRKAFVLDCIHLNSLSIEIYMPTLRGEQPFSSRLTTICLQNCRLKEDPMPILEKLVNLKEVRLFYRSFSGRKMVCSGGGFTQLHTLALSGLEELEEWTVEEGSMPLLHTLAISDCKRLRELPDGVKYITSLKDMYISYLKGYLRWYWEVRLSEGGDDYYKVRHIPCVMFERS